MTQAILDLVEQQISEHLYPGASLSLYQNGVWTRHYLGTVDGKEPTKKGLVYDLASVSKVVGVATICAFWLQEGRLDLDQTLKYYYPAFQNETVTLRQLLTHSSGIDPFIPNRDQLNAEQLKLAINEITVTDAKSFLYTDINFLLLGFMLEELSGNSLDQLFDELIFHPWRMFSTSFGPFEGAVPTLSGVWDGIVHDPKAKVLKNHSGSAGLFSTIADLEKFCQHYLADDFAAELFQNYSCSNKSRSIGWNQDGDWLDHTGYTGTYILTNRKKQKAAVFLTNRTHDYDDRPLWIERRKEIENILKDQL